MDRCTHGLVLPGVVTSVVGKVRQSANSVSLASPALWSHPVLTHATPCLVQVTPFAVVLTIGGCHGKTVRQDYFIALVPTSILRIENSGLAQNKH